MQRKFELDGRPYYLREHSPGTFLVAKSFWCEKENGANVTEFEWNEDIGELLLGLNIRELPNRNLNLLLEVPKCEPAAHYLIPTLIKFAQVVGCDYVCPEFFGNYTVETIHQRGDITLFKAIPRLFRKIVND